jgi:signal peptidase II
LSKLIYLGEEVEVLNWFKILFIENEGMAWEPNSRYMVNCFNTFRLAVGESRIGCGILIKKHSSNYLIVAIAHLAGAFGNIIDSVFVILMMSPSN